jgi:hypothetical protein
MEKLLLRLVLADIMLLADVFMPDSGASGLGACQYDKQVKLDTVKIGSMTG